MVEAMWKSKMAEKNLIIIIQMWQEIASAAERLQGCKEINHKGLNGSHHLE